MQAHARQQPYEQRLRAIGARLDTGGYHAVTIVEVGGGLIVRASAPGSRTPEVLEIPDADGATPVQLARMRTGVPHRLFPDGYKGFLSTLGRRLDRSDAAAISIVEGTDFVTVGGIQPVAEADGEIMFEPLDILLLPTDILTIAETPLEPETPEIDSPGVTVDSDSAARNSLTGGLAGRISGVLESALRSASLVINSPARTRS